MKYYIYLLKSLKNNTYYIGSTSNLDSRLDTHNSGKVKYTSRNRPYVLIGYETSKTSKDARWREYEVKHSAWKRKQFINNLVPVAQLG